MDTAYHPDFGRTIAFQFEQMPEDSDGQVRYAIAKAIGLIREDAARPTCTVEGQKLTNPILADAVRAAESGDPIKGVWSQIKNAMRFRQDADIAKDLNIDDPRKDDIVEVFIRPIDQSILIALRGVGVEDCDGFTMYGACLLTALGIPCSLVTVSADRKRPTEFSHVYVAAYFNGQRIPLDFSHGEYPGWECPNFGRIKEWPIWETKIERITNAAVPIAALVAAFLGIRWLNRRDK